MLSRQGFAPCRKLLPKTSAAIQDQRQARTDTQIAKQAFAQVDKTSFKTMPDGDKITAPTSEKLQKKNRQKRMQQR